MNLDKLETEQRNPDSEHIDALSTIDMVRLINHEDQKVAKAVENILDSVAKAVDVIADQLKNGGRLIYIGSGTSGRLGILDAVECPPTFSTDPDQVVGLISGGYPAMFKAVEGAEDDEEAGKKDLIGINFCKKDVLVGIAASGRTPYVLGAMKYARTCGAHVIGIACCSDSKVEEEAEIAILPKPGPEVITGSTRMKCGTAEKMVLNMLSTGAMIRLGKVYGNLMVDVRPSNEKLMERCKRIVSEVTKVSKEEAEKVLEQCNYQPKIAIVMILFHVDANEATKMLTESGGRIYDLKGKNRAEADCGIEGE